MKIFTRLFMFMFLVTLLFQMNRDVLIASSISTFPERNTGEVAITGELKTWHCITLSFNGPESSENAESHNPFTDYRLTVTFTDGNQTFRVPGFYAADGNAAETGATSGNIWRVHFTPPDEGRWKYAVSFRAGTEIAVKTAQDAGSSVAPLDGSSGSFTVEPTDKSGRDFRARGMLQYVDAHYMQESGTGEYFIKGGVDSPENLLGYEDFDGTYDRAGHVSDYLHHYSPHIGDWKTGDPTWRDGKGKGLIGAINYLSEIGINSMYFLTQNVNGDGDDTWPWTAHDQVRRFDVSKLAQWEIVFSHMQHKGIMMHVVHQEQENDQYLNEGDLGFERKLYYKELIARFAHHPALVWNMGEENTNTHAQRKAFAAYIREVDPYDHPIVVHTYPGDIEEVYSELLNNPNFEGTSFQINHMGDLTVHDILTAWYDRSENAGKSWLINFDEIHPHTHGLKPDAVDPDHADRRKYDLWAAYMAGACGMEWYCGSEADLPAEEKASSNRDRTLENFRTRENMWVQTRIAREFFETLPLQTMQHHDALTSSGLCFADPAEVYVLYLIDGGSTTIDLQSSESSYTVRWYDPRNGGEYHTGSVNSITGPGKSSVGEPPHSPNQDWTVIVKRQ